jgi:hypothetical protein
VLYMEKSILQHGSYVCFFPKMFTIKDLFFKCVISIILIIDLNHLNYFIESTLFLKDVCENLNRWILKFI